MASKKLWSEGLELESKLPIDISRPKAYVIADLPFYANHWTRIFRLESGGFVKIRATQIRPGSNKVQLRIEAKKKLSETDRKIAIQKIRYELGLDEEMKNLRFTARNDPIVKFAVQSNTGLRLFANSESVETTLLTIISQNTSFFSYLDLTKNFVQRFGDKTPWKNELAFPSIETISKLKEEEWKKLGMGYKSKFLANLDEDVLEEFEIYSNYPVFSRGLDQLLKIPGVGNYTARCLMTYHARRYDLAIQDSYVMEVLSHKYELHRRLAPREYDRWIHRRWPKDPALILHFLLQDYLPAYLTIHGE